MPTSTLSILMIHPHDLWYDPWTIRILALARGLIQRGHRVSLCHLPRKERPESGPIREPQPGDPDIYELRPRQQHFVHNIRLIHSLAKGCDLIHLQKCFAAAALPALWVSRRLNKPLHYDWDDNESALTDIVERRFWTRFQIKCYERGLPFFADTLTYASHAIEEKAIAFGFPNDRMRHLPVGADIERFAPQEHPDRTVVSSSGLKPDKPVVLYIGQMEGAAHAHLLIDAAPKVLAEMPDAQFLLVGGGEQLEEIRGLAQRSPVREAIAVPGYVAGDRIPAIVRASDICVACFHDDDASRCKSPLKIAEYLASGKPIVASNVGEVPYMLGDSGMAVEPGSADALAEGILAYMRDPQRREADGHKARQRAVEFFTWDRGVDTLLELYGRIA